MGQTFISPNPVKTTERIDSNGNVINPKTKQIITPVETVYIPPTPPPEPTPEPTGCPVTVVETKGDGLSVLEQIEQAKAHLQSLEELKRLKIEEKKKELELLQQ